MKYDAIVLIGGGLKKNGAFPLWVKRRIAKTLELFNGKEYIIATSRATSHKAPPLKKGFPVDESIAAAKYLIRKEVPANKILAETVSLDTIGNAYFARVIHTEPRGLKRLCVITSEFHMPRTKAIFDWVFGLKPLHKYKINYVEVSDKGIDAELMKVRYARERQSLKKVLANKKSITTLAQFHAWLFTKHEAYAPGLKPKKVKGKILESY